MNTRCGLVAALALALVAAAVGAQRMPAAVPPPRPLPVATADEPRVRKALALLEERRSGSVENWAALCRIGALPGRESARAAAYARMLTEAGVPAKVLPDGNVEARIAGRAPGAPAVLSAHLDALHEPSAANPVRISRGRMEGPGVLDDGSGLAAIAAAMGALADAGWRPRRELRIVATVSEEVGLIGARSYVAGAGDLAAFVTVDGILGRVDHGGTGIRWTRFSLRGQGGHTLLADQVASPSFAAGRAIAGLADLAEREQAMLNVSELRGGHAPNAVPEEVSFTVDLRSDDAAAFALLIAESEEVVRAAARGEGVRASSTILQDLPVLRPRGAESSELVRGATAILRHVGVAPRVSPRGSADHVVALMKGIPAIAVGSTLGSDAHSASETAEIEPFHAGCRQVLLLAVLLGEGLPEPGVVGQ